MDKLEFSQSVQSLSHVWLFVTPWTAARQASLSIINSRSLLKLMSIALVMPSNQLILSCPLLLPPSIFPSIRIFSSESVLHIRWPKCWSFSFSIGSSNEYSGLISCRIDWLDLLAVQGTLKSLLQHRSSKASILRHSGLFMVQLSHPYMTTDCISKSWVCFCLINKFICIIFLDSPYKWYHITFVFDLLQITYFISLSMIISRSIHLVANGIISFI